MTISYRAHPYLGFLLVTLAKLMNCKISTSSTLNSTFRENKRSAETDEEETGEVEEITASKSTNPGVGWNGIVLQCLLPALPEKLEIGDRNCCVKTLNPKNSTKGLLLSFMGLLELHYNYALRGVSGFLGGVYIGDSMS